MATLGLALLVMVLVALPNLRADTRIPLSPDERALIRARRRNRYHPKPVARRTWQAAVRFQQRAVRVWAGVVRAGHALVRVAQALARAGQALVRAARGLAPVGQRVVRAGQNLAPVGQRVVRAGQRLAPAGQAGLRGLTALHQRISAAWAPVSRLLHEALDRLEGHQAASQELSRQTENTRPAADIVIEPTADPDPVAMPAGGPAATAAGAAPKRGPVRDRFDVAAVTAGRPIGRPRSFPAISGPIPEIREAAQPEPAADATVIDLRHDTDAEQDSAHEPSAGSIQNAR